MRLCMVCVCALDEDVSMPAVKRMPKKGLRLKMWQVGVVCVYVYGVYVYVCVYM